jgi:Uncharacterised nucleotidyltransferase
MSHEPSSQGIFQWASQERAERALAAFVARMEPRIPVLPVKGIILRHDAYANPLDRHIRDVDVLVRPSDFGSCLEVARAEGWRIVRDSMTIGGACFVIGGFSVDAKSHFGPPGTSAIGVDAMLHRAARSSAPLGFPHWHIDLHDHVLLVAADAFKDKLELKPQAVEDLDSLGRLSGFDVHRIVARAGEARLQTMLYLVADWLCTKRATGPWERVRDALSERPIRRGYVQRFRRHAEGRAQGGWSGAQAAVLARAVSDDPTRAAWALALGAVGVAGFYLRHGGLRRNPWA